uniref:E2 ubiquitin-conjugating enzyme n=1 Tax=Drosophila pseudoobscura pseudoobscura TaxID=46245 RepID=A0A0R3NWR6_DROPS
MDSAFGYVAVIYLREEFQNRWVERVAATAATPRSRTRKEIAKMTSNPTEWCTVELVDDSIYTWSAVILGPSNTPYEGGHFALEIQFPISYPFDPPVLKFLTKIYHCNIAEGRIHVDILSSSWSPVLTVDKILLSIQSLLSDPIRDSRMMSAAAAMFKEDREKYDRLAREWTDCYAKIQVGVVFVGSSGARHAAGPRVQGRRLVAAALGCVLLPPFAWEGCARLSGRGLRQSAPA